MDFLLNTQSPEAPLPADLIKDSDTASFMVDVIEASQHVPVVVDFWAPWCGPCKQIGPVLEKLVLAARGKIRLVKIDTDKNQSLAAQLRIQSIPTIYAFKDGRPVDGFSGNVPQSQIKAFIERLIALAKGGPDADMEQALSDAQVFLNEGNFEEAYGLFASVLQNDGENAKAMTGILRCMIGMGAEEEAKETLESLPDDLKKNPEIAALALSWKIADETAGLQGQTAELQKRLQADPNDHQARLDLAMAYFGASEREKAVDELLELIRRDRSWNDEAGRKQLITFFDAFGPSDPLTIASRKRLSSLLFS